ncbi:MAG TPA: substrate-binding domain-containing protein [Anaerolineales bacterium]|nr:substrate-binding domain-containing protein [Anaerolineales bacterium]
MASQRKAQERLTTIALLTTGPIDPNNRAIWSGAEAAARDSGVNLICYPGRLVRSPVGFESQRNVIYEMVNDQRVDGLVVMGGLNAWLNLDETYNFLQQFRPRPIVTTGIVLDGFPGVTVDNYHGMYEVIDHLVKVHQCRRIAFIRGQAGHQEAIDRYQAYLDILVQHNLPFDPQLVYQGDFKESGGIQGAKTLFEERRVQFDALVAASDNMAIGAMKTLQARGVRVPTDIAIAGLNGEEEGLVVSPPLTTAPLHFYEQAYQATLMVLSLLDGKQVPTKVVLPTRMVVRQSCGCPDPLVSHAEAMPHTEKLDSFTNEIRMLDSLVFGGADSQLRIPPDEPMQRLFPALLKAFLDQSRGKAEGEFLRQFVETIQETVHTNDDFPRWHEIISILRQFAISESTDTKSRLRIENLAQQARVLIGEAARRHYAYQVLQADEKLHTLGEINQGLSVVTSMAELADVLERSLALLNIPRCYLFMYEDPLNPCGLARFIFSYENHRRVFFEPRGLVFLACQLLPDDLLTLTRQCSLVVEPLFFREDQLGYAIFEADPQEEAIYEILGGQISASLKRTLLTERNIRLFDEAVEARQIAEQANLLKSRFLSMVSHELRTPLALIVGTIEMMLQEENSGSSPPLPESYRNDMEGIHASSKHLFRLIGDVLDLASNQAGELRLVTEPLDLAALFAEAAVLGKSMAREKGLEWREQIPLRLPLVMGDRTRLRQVTLNLLSNAVKFTEHGHVFMAARATDQSVLVEVSDTGMGIPAGEQEAIFDEFRRSERSVARGYGGMGLGLAITRRLIELHGGQIGVRSAGQDEIGSTFYFSLPVMVSPQAGVEINRSRRNIVLLLSEDPSTPLRQHLQQKGFEVEVLDVSRQPDWLPTVVAQPPGAVVLDFQPATERGWELMQLLKQNPETRDVPVLFYHLAAGQARGSMLELDYLSKPVASSELFQTLERLGLKYENGRCILVVDDDPNVLDLHVRMLESRIHGRVLKAHNGRQALEIMQQESPALVLLDLMMPEVDGFEVLRVMRTQEGTRNIPVVVLSAQILTAHDMLRLQEGVAAVLGKGLFGVNEVLAQVEAALNHSKRLGSQASRIVRQAMAFIHEHYDEPISRAELASHVAITERYLTHCFHQEMGITPMIYLNRYRVKRAKILLEQGKLSITGVAMAVGFSDGSYFNRVFRQETGVAPSAYQRGARADGTK